MLPASANVMQDTQSNLSTRFSHLRLDGCAAVAVRQCSSYLPAAN